MDFIGKFTPGQADFVTSALIGFVTPWVVAFFNHRKLSDQQRVGVAVLVSLTGAVLQTLMLGEFHFTNLATAFTIIFPVSQTIYRNVAVKLGVRKFEDLTTPDGLRAPNDEPLPTSSTTEAAAAVVAAVERTPETVAAASQVYTPEDVRRIAEGVEGIENGKRNNGPGA